jgi:porin
LRHGNQGAYVLAEGELFREADADQGCALFGRLGTAAPHVHRIAYATSGGISCTGLVPSRDEDQVGLGVAAVLASDEAQPTPPDTEVPAEVTFEAAYRSVIMPWLALQLDLQMILNPGLSRERDDVLAVGTRTEIVF